MKTTEESFLVRRRTLVLLAAVILFLPPLSLLFQAVSGDTNFCGKWCPRMFFTWRAGMTGGDFLLGMARSYLGVALVAGMAATTLFLGRYWCSHACPVGAATELGSRLLPRFLKIDYRGIPAAPVRYGYLSVYLIAPLVGLGSLCCSYCNFATVPRIFGALFSHADLVYFFRAYGMINLGMIVLLGFAARGGRAYCNFFCPVGAVDALFSKVGDLLGGKRMRITHQCNGCGACRDACPTGAVRLEPGRASIDQLSCVPCGGCATACPRHAVAYGGKTLPAPVRAGAREEGGRA